MNTCCKFTLFIHLTHNNVSGNYNWATTAMTACMQDFAMYLVLLYYHPTHFFALIAIFRYSYKFVDCCGYQMNVFNVYNGQMIHLNSSNKNIYLFPHSVAFLLKHTSMCVESNLVWGLGRAELVCIVYIYIKKCNEAYSWIIYLCLSYVVMKADWLKVWFLKAPMKPLSSSSCLDLFSGWWSLGA